MSSKSSKEKSGGATFGYVEQFNYPLSPCYKNTVKAGWHSGGGSCSKKTVEGLSTESYDSQLQGGGIFDWLFGDTEKKKTKKKSKITKSKKSDDESSEKKKKSTATKKKSDSETSEKKKKSSATKKKKQSKK